VKNSILTLIWLLSPTQLKQIHLKGFCENTCKCQTTNVTDHEWILIMVNREHILPQILSKGFFPIY
jgi:hypothetical protein